VVAVDAGPDQPLRSGLVVPLIPQIQRLGPAPYPVQTEWTVEGAPAPVNVSFSLPDTNGIATQATLDHPGAFVFRLTADTGDAASCDDLGVGAIHSFDEWIGGFESLTPADRLPGADPDSDLVNNAMEYELGTPPDCTGCVPAASRPGITVRGPSASALQLRVVLRRGAMERGLGLAMQCRSNLLSGVWSGCPVTIEGIEETDDFEFQRLLLNPQLTPAEQAEPANYFRPVYSY
jgi:hypothetical protein